MTLGEFLADAACRPYALGIWDCVTFPAAWAMANGHDDPLGDWRGGYVTEDVADAETGMFDLFAEQAEAAGLIRTEMPVEGDIGVVSLFGRQAGAIFTGRRWAMLAPPRGLAFASLDAGSVLGVWRLAHG
jgi:hypothetical protein